MNALLSVWLQVAVLGLVALAIERVALRRAPAALRELLWTLVLLRLLLPAEWVALPGLPDGSGLSAFGAGLSAAGGGDAIAAGRAIDTWVIWTWAGGAAAFLLVGLRAHRSALRPLVADRRPPSPAWQRAARRAARRLGLGRSFELAATTARAAPCVSGWWRPTVHVPAAEPPGTSALDREHVLLHELAHVRRHDPLRAG
ncbi:MAG: hypothetical protein KDE27_20900, partial [Planctomycetes bacterium]|nr:hypothetical protein [Planctomycetota bacterium]